MKIIDGDKLKAIAREIPAFQFYEGDIRDVESLVLEVSEISDEEFKAEAKRRGYNLIKIQPYVKVLPCVCGSKPVLWSDPDGNFYRCDECWWRSSSHKRVRQARLNWNKMIEEKMKDAGKENG